LTFCTYRRAPLLVHPSLIDVLVTQILRAGNCAAFAILAYCFMPDHVHLLVEGTSQEALLPRFLKLAKQLSGFHGKRVVGSAIWQAGCYERLLRLDEDSRRVAAYILLNPVRGHLVSRPEDYPFSGSGVFTRAELFAYARLDQ
jgi:putative transposase